jgi:hypothetical protein
MAASARVDGGVDACVVVDCVVMTAACTRIQSYVARPHDGLVRPADDPAVFRS